MWSPSKRSQIDAIVEKVQRRAAKQIPGLGNLSYEERLEVLDLPTLEHRRVRADMIEVYRIMKGIYDNKTSIEMSINTGP